MPRSCRRGRCSLSPSVPPPRPGHTEDDDREDQREREQRAVPAVSEAEIQKDHADTEQGVDEHERQQGGLHAAPKRVHQMQGDHEQERDRRGALDEPRPHAALRIPPALDGGPLALEDATHGPAKLPYYRSHVTDAASSLRKSSG